jgi:hypothetical protein
MTRETASRHDVASQKGGSKDSDREFWWLMWLWHPLKRFFGLESSLDNDPV